jgi:hypothetical protein
LPDWRVDGVRKVLAVELIGTGKEPTKQRWSLPVVTLVAHTTILTDLDAPVHWDRVPPCGTYGRVDKWLWLFPRPAGPSPSGERGGPKNRTKVAGISKRVDASG